jgi:hypothetical protein
MRQSGTASGLLYEWEAAAEIGWQRGLNPEETRALLRELSEVRPLVAKLYAHRPLTLDEAEQVEAYLGS